MICGPTEYIWYRLGRRLAGFSGAHHVRNIEDIRQPVELHFSVVSLGTLYPGIPLFKIFMATRPGHNANQLSKWRMQGVLECR
jgi:hypothetical protein